MIWQISLPLQFIQLPRWTIIMTIIMMMFDEKVTLQKTLNFLHIMFHSQSDVDQLNL